MSRPSVDRSSPEYKREFYLYSTIVIVLTLVGGFWLGSKINAAEQVQSDPEKLEQVLEERKASEPKRPGIEQGIIY
ncbi:MAG: hypothetical protein AAGI01_06565 [Myxococcota bacterium]